ncbi:MAG: hypothetical protein JO266_03985 [Acidobacteria bacterium]|nr:hypothetical protein [Acidobacteriota bacterium]
MPLDTATGVRERAVNRLAKFFSAACPVRIPVRLERGRGAQIAVENTVIEFGTAQEVLFGSALPLDIAERLRVENLDGSLNVEVEVVAVQCHEEERAVAARFLQQVPHWILKG